MLADIDYFKPYNDNYGHSQGDRCLQQVAMALASVPQRSVDLMARYGGEEFSAVLPHTDYAAASQIGNRLLETISALNIPHAHSNVASHITLSVGVAAGIPTPHSTPLTLLEAADKFLYEAKRTGRNKALGGTIIL
jgi:diguanylate cyclase (GGDEF)-like protein